MAATNGFPDVSPLKDSYNVFKSEPVAIEEPSEKTELAQDLMFLVTDYFEPLLEYESSVELLKTELCMRRDFSLASAFNLFSRTLQAKVTLEDFMFALDKLGITGNPKDVSLMYRRYDSDNDNRLGFWEFCNWMLPIDVRYREEVEQRQACTEFSHETMDLFKRLLTKVIQTEVQVEGLR